MPLLVVIPQIGLQMRLIQQHQDVRKRRKEKQGNVGYRTATHSPERWELLARDPGNQGEQPVPSWFLLAFIPGAV